MSTQRRKVANGRKPETKMTRKPKGITRRSGANFPPKLLTNGRFITVIRRFTAVGAVNGQFTIQSGINQFVVATTAALVNPYISMWRIKKVEIWSPSDPTNASNPGSFLLNTSGSIDPNNNFNTQPKNYEDTATGLDKPAHGIFKPTKIDPAGGLHRSDAVNTTQVLFGLSCTNSSIVDITFEICLNLFQGVFSYSAIVAGAVAGTLYARIPITNLTPTGVNAI
jgi:hypothetical protein